MKNIVFISIITSLLFLFVSCEKKEEIENNELFSLEKDVYYCCESEGYYDYEWDAMIIKNDTALFAKRDTVNNNVLYFINNIKNSVESGICYLISEDGTLIYYGNSKCVLHYAHGISDDFLWTLDDEGKILTIPVERKELKNTRKLNKSKSTKKTIWTPLNNIIDLGGLIEFKNNPFSAISTAKDIYELIENSRNGKDNEFLFNSSNMILMGGISFVGSPALSMGLGLFFWEINNGIENAHEKFREKLYGENVNIKIDSFKENIDGTVTAVVTVSGINDIPKFIYNYDDYACIPTLQNKNYIMIGVLARYMFEPEYDSYEYCSQEVAIDLDGNDEQNFNLTLPSMPSGRYYIRPYIRSNREEIFNRFNKSIDKDDVVYGESVTYDVFNGRITGSDLKVAEYSEEYNKLHFVYYVTAELSSIKDVEEWGIYEEVDGEKVVHKMLNFSSKQQNRDDIRFEEYVYHDYIDYENCNAVKVKYVGVYVKYKDLPGEENPDNITYSEPYELLLIYHKIPHVRIVDISYDNTRDFYDRNYPQLYHGKLSTFNVKLDVDTKPFGDFYGENGGVFYQELGGYSDHPYQYFMSKIEEDYWSEYYENGYLNRKLYVYHYYKEQDRGNNNIYYRYTLFGENNYIMPGENYIEFVYNSSQRAYTSARLKKGNFPEYKLIEVN